MFVKICALLFLTAVYSVRFFFGLETDNTSPENVTFNLSELEVFHPEVFVK